MQIVSFASGESVTSLSRISVCAFCRIVFKKCCTQAHTIVSTRMEKCNGEEDGENVWKEDWFRISKKAREKQRKKEWKGRSSDKKRKKEVCSLEFYYLSLRYIYFLIRCSFSIFFFFSSVIPKLLWNVGKSYNISLLLII